MTWRPKTFYRRQCVKLLEVKDNLIRVMTDKPGLSYALYNPKLAVWADANWMHWPSILCGEDQAGEDVSACHALTYHKETMCNYLGMWETSHGINNDFSLTYDALGKKDFVLLILVTLNLKHGPDKDQGMRYWQQKDVAMDVIDNWKMGSFSLFQARSPRLQQEFAGEYEVDERGFDFVMQQLVSEATGTRCKMSEYLSWHRCSSRSLNWRTYEFFKKEFLGLEHDMLQSRKLLCIPHIAPTVLEHVATTTTTSTSVTSVEAKIIRSVGKNNVVATVALLSKYSYRRLLAVLTRHLGPLSRWQGNCVQACLNSLLSGEWLLDELAHSFLQVLDETFATLSDPEVLRSCGYFEFEKLSLDSSEFATFSLEDQEFADLSLDLVLTIVAKRERRLMYVAEGILPLVWRALRRAPGSSTDAPKRVKAHVDAYEWANSLERPSKFLQKKLGRSPIPTIPVKQVVTGYRLASWEHRDDMDFVSRKWVYGLHSSNVVELVNNLQKNNKQCRGTMKWRRPERLHAVTLASNMLPERFKLKVPEPSIPVERKDFKLSATAFGKTPVACSLNLAGICSTSAKAPYFSPVAGNIGLPFADLAVFSDAFKSKRRSIFDDAFLGCFAECRPRLVFKRTGCGDRDFPYHVPLDHYSESAVLAWLVDVKPPSGEAPLCILQGWPSCLLTIGYR